MLIGKFLAHLLGNTDEEVDAAESNDVDDTCEDACEDLVEFEEGGWIIVNMMENLPLELPEEGPLENLLIEHPSMSVYQMRHTINREEDLESDEEDSPRPAQVQQHVSWRLAAWGSPLPCHLHLLSLADRKRLTKSALHRQNLAKTRFCPSERRYGHFKQPCQRLYNY